MDARPCFSLRSVTCVSALYCEDDALLQMLVWVLTPSLEDDLGRVWLKTASAFVQQEFF